MYIEMLQEAIAEKKGEVKPEVKEPVRAQVQVDGYIPKQLSLIHIFFGRLGD